MNKKIIIFLMSFLLSCQLMAGQRSEPQQIAAKILNKFMAIEKQVANYKKKNLSLNKTLITVWYQDNNIKKVLIESENEMGNMQDNYYLDENELILCRSITNNFSLEADGKLSKEKKIDKQYLLYQSGELVKPSSSPQINNKYLELGIAKRTLLIETLAIAFINQ